MTERPPRPTHEPYSSLTEMVSYAAGILDLMGRNGESIARELLRRTNRLPARGRLNPEDAFFFMPGPFYQTPRINFYSKLKTEPMWQCDQIAIQGFLRQSMLPDKGQKSRVSLTTSRRERARKEIKVSNDIAHVRQLTDVIAEATDINPDIPDDFSELISALPFEDRLVKVSAYSIQLTVQGQGSLAPRPFESVRVRAAKNEARNEFLDVFYHMIEQARRRD